MKIFYILLITSLCVELNAQQIQIKHHQTAKILTIKPKKIRAIISMDGAFFEGRPKVRNNRLYYGETSLPLSDVGIIEVKKGSLKNVVSYPFKLIGAVSSAVGILLINSATNDDVNEEPSIFIAGLSLIGAGTGFIFLGKKTSPSQSETMKSFHAKDWEFFMVNKSTGKARPHPFGEPER